MLNQIPLIHNNKCPLSDVDFVDVPFCMMSYGAVGSERRRSGDMGSEDSRPLLGEEGDETDDIKVEMPDLPHVTRSEIVNIPDDILKTFLCAIFMGCGSLATAFSIALVHER